MTIDFDCMEFVCWVDRCLFPHDLIDEMVDLGMDKRRGAVYKSEMTHKNNIRPITISGLYQSYCVDRQSELGEEDFGYWLKLWLDKMYVIWQGYKK